MGLLGAGASRVLAAFDAFDAAHPHDEPHYYLSLLGTDPAHYGHGYGLGLLGENLRIVDAEGMPAYLEASNPANVPLYERYGFRQLDQFELARRWADRAHDVAAGGRARVRVMSASFFLVDEIEFPDETKSNVDQSLVEAAQRSGARRKYLARGEGGFYSQVSWFPAGYTVPLHQPRPRRDDHGSGGVAARCSAAVPRSARWTPWCSKQTMSTASPRATKV